MKIGIMQPYFLPYIGYWQLVKAVDVFVIYDNIEYTKQGWINRNRFLQNGKDAYFTLPLKKDSDFLDVKARYIADSFDRNKILNQIKTSYQKAPYFTTVFPVFKKIIEYDNINLFNYIYASILQICDYLNISTKIIKSSKIAIDRTLKAEHKVMAICNELNADIYINAIGGQGLYSKKCFRENNIELKFIKADDIQYKQFNNEFIPCLSILDVMMFNQSEKIESMLNQYTLI